MVICTAGHIDHGKSALVKALTGVDPDRLKEERERGITLDLGFAPLSVAGTLVGVVDVPGHERLVHNMLAGATGADMALVVVAADEGVKPQTVEHVEILDLLGLRHAVGVVTKVDLVDEARRAQVRAALHALFAPTTMAESPVVEVSSLTGEGLEALRDTIAHVAARIPARPVQRPFRLPVDRVFTLRGVGTVATGTSVAGRVRPGDVLDVLPHGGSVRVRGIHVHGSTRQEAQAGERTALNVVGDTHGIRRGQVLAERGLFSPSAVLDCRVRIIRPSPPRGGAMVAKLFVGTQEVLARVVPLEQGVLPGPGEGYAQLRPESPVAAARADRFVLRTPDDRDNLGGGVVIDATAARHGPMGGRSKVFLAAMEREDDTDALEGYLSMNREGVSVARAAAFLNLRLQDASGLVSEAQKKGTIRLCADKRVVSGALVEAAKDELRAHLRSFHDSSHQPAVSLSQLLKWSRGPRAAVEVALQDLSASGEVRVEGSMVRLSSHVPLFAGDHAKTRDAVVAFYHRAGLSPPSAEEVVRELSTKGFLHVREVVDSLVGMGFLVSLAPGLIVETDAVRRAREVLLPLLRAPGGVTVSQARQALGISRKYTVPLLEYLDRSGFTLRRGDVRILSPRWKPAPGGETGEEVTPGRHGQRPSPKE